MYKNECEVAWMHYRIDANVNGCKQEEACFFFFQAEDGIRGLVRSRGLGDVYKRQ